jgi:hypothetical protein
MRATEVAMTRAKGMGTSMPASDATVGGVLLILGAFTRPTAFVLSGFMAVAYFMAHASRGSPLLPILNGGELAVLYSFLFLFLFISTAGGPYGGRADRSVIQAEPQWPHASPPSRSHL